MKIAEPDHPVFIYNYDPGCPASLIFKKQRRGITLPAAMTDWNSEVVLVSYFTKCPEVVNAEPFKRRLYCHYSDIWVFSVIRCYLLQRRKTISMAPGSPFLEK